MEPSISARRAVGLFSIIKLPGHPKTAHGNWEKHGGPTKPVTPWRNILFHENHPSQASRTRHIPEPGPLVLLCDGKLAPSAPSRRRIDEQKRGPRKPADYNTAAEGWRRAAVPCGYRIGRHLFRHFLDATP